YAARIVGLRRLRCRVELGTHFPEELRKALPALQSPVHVGRRFAPLRPKERHVAAEPHGFPMPSQLTNSLVHADCEIVTGVDRRMPSEQLHVGFRAGLDAEQSLYRPR